MAKHGHGHGGGGLFGQATAAVSYTPGDILSAATFARASVATQLDINGLVQPVASGVPRDAHYINGVRTYLSEPAATNRILQNGTINNASWTTDHAVVNAPGITGGVVVDPTGTAAGASAISFVAVTGAGARSTVGQTPAGQPLAPQVFSKWIRGNLGTEVVWLMSTADGITFQSTQCTLTNKWKRYSVTTGSAGNYRVSIGVDLRDGTQSAKPVQNVYVWGAGLEDGSVMSSTIPNLTTSAATRAADSLTIPWVSTPIAMTLYLNVIDQGITAQADATGKVLASIGAGTDRFTVSASSVPDISLNYRTASTDHKASDTASLASFGDTIEVLASVTSGGSASIQHAKNGGALTTVATTSATLPSVWGSSNIEIASLGGAQQGGIAVAALVVIAGAITLARSRAAARTPIGVGADTTPAAVVVSPASLNLTVGGADVTVTSTVTNQAGSTLSTAIVVYSSNAPSVFTVNSSSGVVHAVGAGNGVLTARTANGITTTTAISVAADTTPNAVTISPTSAAMTVGGPDVTFAANVTNAAGTALPGASIAFTSSNSAVATVTSPQGVCHALSVGSTTITVATSNGKTATASVTVSPDLTPATVTVAPATLSLTAPGPPGTLTATVKNAGGTTLAAAVTWSSSQPGVATVNSAGVVTPVGIGTTTITATTANSHSGTCAVTVAASTTPTSIVIAPTTTAMVVGGADVTCTATVSGASGVIAGSPVSFTSSNPAAATVNIASGSVHAVAAGTATITATTSNGLTATCAATISAPNPRGLIFPHACFGNIERWSGAADTVFANAHYSDIDGGTLTSHPNAVCVQHYGILLTSESNEENSFDGVAWSPPNDFPLVLFLKYADAYATAHSQNVEDYWMHALSGQPNNVAGIYNISAGGAISFWYPEPGGGPVSSYPFTPGQTVTLAGLSAGNGTYTIASLQKFGITLNAWSAGALGPAGVNGHTKIGTVSTPGDGTLVKANRVQSFGWASWVLQCSFLTPSSRAMHAQRFADYRGDTNGVLIDNMASGGNYNSMTVSQEYGAQQFDTQVPPQRIAAPQWVTDVSATLTGIRTQPGGPTYLRINNAAYTFANDAALIRAAKGAHDESSLTLVPYDQTELNFVIARVAEGNDIEYVNGATWSISGGVGTMQGLPGSYNAGNYPTTTARGQMSLYTLYLMAVDPTFTIADGTTQKHCTMYSNGMAVGQTPLSAMWQPGFEFNIGQPTGPMTQTQRTDPSGQSIRTLTRSFSLDGGATLSAFVVYNHNVNGQTNYGDNSLMVTALPTAASGRAWYMLNADGTVGATPLTSVSHRRSEGVIVVAKGAGVLAQRADAFVSQIGVNTHVLNEPYLSGRDTLFIPALTTLGVRNVRDATVGSSATGVVNMATVARITGAKLNLVTKPGVASYSDTYLVDYVTSGIDPATISRLEGPDEVNNTTYYGATSPTQVVNVTTWMNALKAYRDGHANAVVRALPITTPSVVTTATIPAVSWAAQSDFGAAHTYPGPVAPGAPLSGAISAVASTWGGVGTLPVLVTATGYETALGATSPAALVGQGISTTAHGKYVPRLVAEYFRQGMAGTFLYELMDDGSDQTVATNAQGLVASDGTAKPGYTSLKNMISILSELTWTPPATSTAGLKLSGTFYGVDPVASGTTNATLVASGSFVGMDAANSPGLAITSNAGGVFGFDSTSGSFSALVPITPSRLNYTLTPGGGVTTIHDLLLQKSDGSFYLLLWNEVESWDVSAGDISNPTTSVAVGFISTRTVTQYTPRTGTSGTFVSTASACTVNVPDEIIILKIV